MHNNYPLKRVIPRLPSNRSPYTVIPRLQSNRPHIKSSLVFVRKRQGIYEFPYSCHGTAFSLFCHTGLFFYLSLRPVFLSVTPARFFICHSGLRAGVQVNIDSLAAWIPGQARNDKGKQEKLIDPLMAAVAPKG